MRLQATSLFFRPLFAFFIIELKSRKVIHLNVTRSPTDPWVAQQLREATPYGQTPKYLIRDTDRKFGQHVARVATTSGIKVRGSFCVSFHRRREHVISLPD
jgi:putative transposase